MGFIRQAPEGVSIQWTLAADYTLKQWWVNGDFYAIDPKTGKNEPYRTATTTDNPQVVYQQLLDLTVEGIKDAQRRAGIVTPEDGGEWVFDGEILLPYTVVAVDCPENGLLYKLISVSSAPESWWEDDEGARCEEQELMEMTDALADYGDFAVAYVPEEKDDE